MKCLRKNRNNKTSRILITPIRASLFAFANLVTLIIRVFTTNSFKLNCKFIFLVIYRHFPKFTCS